MPPAGFEPTISAGERPQTYALDRAATGTDNILYSSLKYFRSGVHKFPKHLGATSKLRAPEFLHEASCVLRTDKY